MPSLEKWSDSSGRIKPASQLLRELEERKRREPLRTGAPLDRLGGGGLRRGSLIELCGPRSSGRFAVALTALAAATRAGEAAALVDLGDHLDPAVAQAGGVDLRRLLWARPQNLKDALACALAALGAGFALVALDLGERRDEDAPPTSWLRLAQAARQSSAILLLVTRRPIAGSAASASLSASRAFAHWDLHGPPLLKGLSADWHKSR
jgi:hypothetical protein